MAVNPRYWFPARRYGWGWPSAWQGWVVVIAFVALLAAGFLLLPPQEQRAAFLAYLAAITALMIAISWLKGEPTRWRWGGKD